MHCCCRCVRCRNVDTRSWSPRWAATRLGLVVAKASLHERALRHSPCPAGRSTVCKRRWHTPIGSCRYSKAHCQWAACWCWVPRRRSAMPIRSWQGIAMAAVLLAGERPKPIAAALADNSSRVIWARICREGELLAAVVGLVVATVLSARWRRTLRLSALPGAGYCFWRWGGIFRPRLRGMSQVSETARTVLKPARR
jgi:hypothetical protein